MNFFKTVLNHIKQWFSSPKTLADEAHAASVAIKVVSPGLVLALQEAGVDNPEVASVSTEVANDLELVSNTLEQIAQGTAGADATQTLVATLQGIKGNVGGILTAAHIKNPDLRAKVTNTYNAFEAEVEVIVQEFSAK